MKKLFFAVIATAFMITGFNAQAQTIKSTTKTITAADTLSFSNVGTHLKAFQYTYTETSGTSAGKVYLEGTINGTYVLLDSLTLADVTTAQTKVFPITAETYLSYRFRNTNTSSATGTVKAYYIRRTDE
jgi:hypothetical protein